MLSHKLAFTVEQIESSHAGSLLLWGSGGAAVVILPDEIAMTQNSSIKCKTHPIGEILLIQIQGLEVVAAKWLPDSVNRVVLLTNDNCLRLFDITSRLTHPLTTVSSTYRDVSRSGKLSSCFIRFRSISKSSLHSRFICWTDLHR